ncbi:MAG: Dabb family protein [Phycisphaerae bacterium]|jgi:uncharacterized protein (DUF1330 family)
MKKLLALLLAAALLPIGASAADTAPKSVIHVVTLKFKDDATPAQIQAALDGVKALPAAFPGITRVWVKSIKVQNARGTEKKRTHALVMEFADEAAFKAYTDSPAQLAWYKVYLPVRDQSTTFDITN